MVLASAGPAPTEIAEQFRGAIVRGEPSTAAELVDVFEMSRRVLGTRAEHFSPRQLERLAALLAQTIQLS